MISYNLLKSLNVAQILVLLIVGGIFFSQTALAFPPNYPDSRFGSSGIAVAPFSANAEGRAIAIAPDGKIVVAGEVNVSGAAKGIAVARFTVYGEF